MAIPELPGNLTWLRLLKFDMPQEYWEWRAVNQTYDAMEYRMRALDAETEDEATMWFRKSKAAWAFAIHAAERSKGVNYVDSTPVAS